MATARTVYRCVLLAFGLAPACVTIEDDPPLRRPTGEAGESCGTRADCNSGLACIHNVCADLDAAAPDGADDAGLQGDAGLEADASAPALALIGEPCASPTICAEGLACVRSVCSGSENGLVPSGRECVVVACRAAEDCCPTPPQNCSFYEQRCTAGDTYYCSLYDEQCVCRPSDWQCVNEQCKLSPACGVNDTCSQGRVCVASLCVECADDSDCLAGKTCIGNACVTACTKDEQCAPFHQCQSGSCVWVGCTTDRECIALTSDPLAACLDQRCRASCVKDSDCNPSGFDGVVCHEGYCHPLGCVAVEECRISLATQLSGGKVAECRAVE